MGNDLLADSEEGYVGEIGGGGMWVEDLFLDESAWNPMLFKEAKKF